jgi:hypothetical protein
MKAPHEPDRAWKYGESYVVCLYCGVTRTRTNDREQCMSAAPTWSDMWPRHKWEQSDEVALAKAGRAQAEPLEPKE